MPKTLIDIGANLGHESFAEDVDEVISAASSHHIEKMLITGATLQGSEDALNLARRYPGKLFSTVGIHPHHAEDTNEALIKRLRELAQSPQVKAIGETGLDFFRDLSPRETQISSFEAHIDIAIDTGLPMFLHERDSYPTFSEVLSQYRDALGKVVVHCFTGEAEALHAYLDLDCYIGITGWICDERRGAHLIPLIKDIPEDRLMIETDSPYLTPRTIRPRPKTRRNVPQNLTYICEFIADILKRPYEEIAERTTRNAEAFFDI